jgi:3alpha(or 20beta)-hydroxysteroid dehydrogenase
MGRLAGKVAIITGAAQGQGAETARLFVSQGAFVVASDILVERGQAVVSSLGANAIFVKHDVSDSAGWTELVAEVVRQHGALDILVNNAGLNLLRPLEETTDNEFERILRINVLGPFFGLRAVAAQMKKQGHGSIVNISSINGLRSNNHMSAYDASKWALRGLSRSLALELGEFGIRVNTVHPGVIDTPMINADGKMDLGAMTRSLGVPLGRAGHSKEVAQATLFLASDEASYVSGAELAVDGGWSAGALIDWSKQDFT